MKNIKERSHWNHNYKMQWFKEIPKKKLGHISNTIIIIAVSSTSIYAISKFHTDQFGNI